MFHLRPNASKFALVRLVEFLEAQGLEWMDIQMVTPLLETMGGRYVSRKDFLMRLAKSRGSARALDWTNV
jgi:leucyl/phenylalanyl-tRNA--protein transferase